MHEQSTTGQDIQNMVTVIGTKRYYDVYVVHLVVLV
jgi:hypothetical protein